MKLLHCPQWNKFDAKQRNLYDIITKNEEILNTFLWFLKLTYISLLGR